jgi:hypothetical protein
VLVEEEVVRTGFRPAVVQADPGDSDAEPVARDQVADQLAELDAGTEGRLPAAMQVRAGLGAAK